MGKVVEQKRKKKKGRPSLLDLQKRSLKNQQDHNPQSNSKKNHKFQNPNPNPNSDSTPNNSAGVRRSTRRNPNPNPIPDPVSEEDGRSGRKRQKKLKHVLQLSDEEAEANSADANSGSDDDRSSGSNTKKRKIGSIAPGSQLNSDDKDEKHGASINQSSNEQGSKPDDGPSTPLPDQKLLLFILDRLQKKDTYGVFAGPVDQEELPDYHEVIAHPMDFSTIRKKLANGSYANLEQFEKDVFLICSNAMQYNAPDTIYFRQARSIQELAKKNFENLRQDSDNNQPDPEPKVVRRGRPPTKNVKRLPGRPPLECANSDFSEVTPPTVANNISNIDTRKRTPLLEKRAPANLFAPSFYGPRYGEAYIGWSTERYEKTDDFTGSATKGILMRHGKKQVLLDENRRNTYNQAYALSCRQGSSVLATFDGERKQLIAVGLHTEFGYARSLARFAAKLGPVAWKTASKKIQRCLPTGVKFGPGWVGENEAPIESPIPHPSSSPTQHTPDMNVSKSAQNSQGEPLSETQTPSARPNPDDGSSKAPSPSSAALEQ